MNNIELLDYFAGQALQSIILKAEPGKYNKGQDKNGQFFAKWAYEFAQAMVEEKEKIACEKTRIPRSPVKEVPSKMHEHEWYEIEEHPDGFKEQCNICLLLR